MKRIDLNCDLGESFGAYHLGRDEEILKLITSANIACGFHAGDPVVMARTIASCLENKVAIGAHPGFPDLQGFGRRAMSIPPKEIYYMVMYQISALQGMVQALGGDLRHVKPHGALYNMAAVNKEIALAIAQAVYDVAPKAILFGLANSRIIKAGIKLGLRTANEVFADRTYHNNGLLTPRTEPHALIHDSHAAVAQVLQMINQNSVTAVDGSIVSIHAHTICLHGDHPSAVEFASSLRQGLLEQNIAIEAVYRWLT